MDSIDTELTHLNLCDQLRSTSSFMKVMATLYYYGNQTMNAAQLVVAVRALDLLPLRGETPKSTIQGIISTSRKIARELHEPDPFKIEKDGAGRQARYCISDEVLNGATVPEIQQIPEEPIIIKPVENGSSQYNLTNQYGKRHRSLLKIAKAKRRKNNGGDSDDNGSDIDIDSEEDGFGASDDETKMVLLPEEDTIFDYSLLYSPPPVDQHYIDAIDFSSYPIASHFAIVQQKGYSYPRFRSQEKIKIPKIRCEDKFRVADISSKDTENGKKRVVGRVFILADGHGGSGCSEYFVRNTPLAIQQLCENYDVQRFDDEKIQQQFKKDIIQLVNTLDEKYLDIKRVQLGRQSQIEANHFKENNTNNNNNNEKVLDIDNKDGSENDKANDEDNDEDIRTRDKDKVDNDGCTLILNIFFGNWLINVNVGDSRSVLISAPTPGSSSPPTTHSNSHGGSSASTSPYVIPPGGFDKDYIMEVAFASQDHKPYLEHLVREIIENGGEFVDSVQNRVIKVELDKLREDGNRQAKRYALKNARIRPKGYQAGQDYSNGGDSSSSSFTAQSAVRTTVLNNNNVNENNNNENNNQPLQPSQPPPSQQHTSADTRATQNGRGRSRNGYVPSLNVARSCGDLDFKMNPNKKIISCEPDVTFIRISDTLPSSDDDDSALSSLAPRTFVTTETDKKLRRNFLFMSTDGTFDYMYEETPERQNRAISKVLGPMIEDGEKIGKYLLEEAERSQTIEHGQQHSVMDEKNQPIQLDKKEKEEKDLENKTDDDTHEMEIDSKSIAKDDNDHNINTLKANTDKIKLTNGDITINESSTNDSKDCDENNTSKVERKPLLYRTLNDKEAKVRNTKEKTLVLAARFFANREGSNGFFSSKLQDYDDCTVILVEI
ncbi:hypothetical protein BJ944DRAFT_263505 [Cunninghamella echinulata]|nr:hypothetical protein BJ944DRAFT_263505 [Cunninghamella echinulata]